MMPVLNETGLKNRVKFKLVQTVVSLSNRYYYITLRKNMSS